MMGEQCFSDIASRDARELLVGRSHLRPRQGAVGRGAQSEQPGASVRTTAAGTGKVPWPTIELAHGSFTRVRSPPRTRNWRERLPGHPCRLGGGQHVLAALLVSVAHSIFVYPADRAAVSSLVIKGVASSLGTHSSGTPSLGTASFGTPSSGTASSFRRIQVDRSVIRQPAVAATAWPNGVCARPHVRPLRSCSPAARSGRAGNRS